MLVRLISFQIHQHGSRLVGAPSVHIQPWCFTKNILCLSHANSLSVCLFPSLFLASLRFCVHYCIDRDTVQKKKRASLLCCCVKPCFVVFASLYVCVCVYACACVRGKFTHTSPHSHMSSQRESEGDLRARSEIPYLRL